MGCSEGHVVGTPEAVKPGHGQEEPRQACVGNQEWSSSEGPMGAQDLEAGAEGRRLTSQHWPGGGHCEVIGKVISFFLAWFLLTSVFNGS